MSTIDNDQAGNDTDTDIIPHLANIVARRLARYRSRPEVEQLAARASAPDVTAEELRSLSRYCIIDWESLVATARRAVDAGVPVGMRRALCCQCGTVRLLKRGGPQDYRDAARLRCSQCRESTEHALLADNDPGAVLHEQYQDRERLAVGAIRAETERLESLGVDVRGRTYHADRRICGTWVTRWAEEGLLLVEYDERREKDSIYRELRTLRILVEHDEMDLLRWRPSFDDPGQDTTVVTSP